MAVLDRGDKIMEYLPQELADKFIEAGEKVDAEVNERSS